MYYVAEISLMVVLVHDLLRKEKVHLTNWASMFETAVYFALFLLAATFVLGLIWAKYSR